jgi:hypothetical protein
MDPCLMVAGSFSSTCQDARGLRAGATIAALGGLRAERRVAMVTDLTAPPINLEALIAWLEGTKAYLEAVEDQLLNREGELKRELAEARGLRVVKGGADA